MPRGSKDKYTAEQKRKAEHIEESYEHKGVSKDEAEARAWATVNKQSGGGERAGRFRAQETGQCQVRRSQGICHGARWPAVTAIRATARLRAIPRPSIV